jgi:hypothetical protein
MLNAFHGLYRDVGWAYVTNGTMSFRVFEADYRAFGYEPAYEKLPWKDDYAASKPSLLLRSIEWGRARFDWTKSHWAPEDEMHAQSWTNVLGSTGVENVRTTLAKTLPAGSQAGVWIGGAVITKGFRRTLARVA